jgi:ABC-2 type transport system ATP-binding protein
MKVWDEVRSLNKNLGITIFMTTQYMEEADQLANRIGIISNGRIITEGTPAELKKKIGKDVVVIRSAANTSNIVNLLSNIAGVGQIDTHGEEITIASADGSKIVGPIALSLHQAGIEVDQLTLRTASLDDVFLEVTGNRLQIDEKKKQNA